MSKTLVFIGQLDFDSEVLSLRASLTEVVALPSACLLYTRVGASSTPQWVSESEYGAGGLRK